MLKSTGVVRRIDDLGRVVIPKELRRSMKIREGDPLEIYTYDGCVCFKKYEIDIDWEFVGKLVRIIYPFTFEILNRWEEPKVSNGKVSESEFTKCEVRCDGEVVAYIAVEAEDAKSYIKDLNRAIRVISEFIAEHE